MSIQQQIVSVADNLAIQAKQVNDRIAEVQKFLNDQRIQVEAWHNVYNGVAVGTSTINCVSHYLGFRKFGVQWHLALAPAAGTTEDKQYAKPLGQCSLQNRILACQHLDAFLVVYYEALVAQQTRCTEVLGEK